MFGSDRRDQRLFGFVSHTRRLSFGDLTCHVQPRRLMIAPPAVGCNRISGSFGYELQLPALSIHFSL
jgi:hypothetical protein